MIEAPSSSAQQPQFLLAGSFNLSNLAALLGKDVSGPPLHPTCAPFGQVMQTLLEIRNNHAETDHLLVWTSPQGASLAFKRLIERQDASAAEILGEVDAFCELIVAVPPSVKTIFVPTWVFGPDEGRSVTLDFNPASGVSLALLRMNLRLVENLSQDSRVVILDASRWLARVGEKAWSQRLWYMSKTPFSAELFKEAASDIRAALQARSGATRKLIVLDLDDTLWGGIVGESGWQSLRLGGHDPVGEAFGDFQIALKALVGRGIVLGIVSKNEEATALEAIRSHPEMILRQDDFAGWRINWNDKARNIAELAAELNLGLQSVVFIDDNPAERSRVQAALPEVLVPDWPANPMEYKAALQRLRCFDQAQISAEDRERPAMYVSERKRRQSAGEFKSVDEWLDTLQIRVLPEAVDAGNLDRVTQLFNKTNQMNLSTRRLTKEELWNWCQIPENRMLAFRVADKFGDYGLAGLASFQAPSEDGRIARLVDFILSCRVMGRKVEETMLHVVSRAAAERGAETLRATYLPTSKNQPCLLFFQNALPGDAAGGFMLGLKELYPKPAPVRIG